MISRANAEGVVETGSVGPVRIVVRVRRIVLAETRKSARTENVSGSAEMEPAT